MAKVLKPEKLANLNNQARIEDVMNALMEMIIEKKTTIFEFMDVCQNMQRVCNADMIHALKNPKRNAEGQQTKDKQ